jgi:hypothetical protein
MLAAGPGGCGDDSSRAERPQSANHRALLAEMCSQVVEGDEPAVKRGHRAWCLKAHRDFSEAELKELLQEFRRMGAEPTR